VIDGLKLKDSKNKISIEELRLMLNQAEFSGMLATTEQDILRRIIHLSSAQIGAVMTPRNKMIWIDVQDQGRDNINKIKKHPFNHFPVVDGGLNNVLGIVEVKNLLLSNSDNKKIIAAAKVPILIGGGHNNAYGLLKGASLAYEQAINCINLDAHSDYRIKEGRHSGNGFRYAKSEHYLGQYAMVGLHENYNSAAIINDLLQDESIQFSFFEDIFIQQHIDFKEAVLQAVNFTDGQPTGIELDLDCIQNVLSSAATPVGISTLQARQFVALAADKCHPAYLHLCEGATQLANGKSDTSTGKLIAYLISDFVKNYS
jgi:arginase family enzyme